MKDLPSVSAFKIEKELNNSQERFYGSKSSINNNNNIRVNVIGKINDIFSSNNHVYKSRVRITLKDDILEKTIIGKTSSELLTLSKEKIIIKDIIDIEKI